MIYNEKFQESSEFRLGIRGRYPSNEIAAPAKQGSPHHWQFSKVHTGSRFTHSFQNSLRIRLYNKIMQAKTEIIQNHNNENVHNIGQGEARQRKYKRLKLGGCQTYGRSSG
jgi:hypothetical protein